MDKIRTYLYKLIPDYSLIDYSEYLYWSSHSVYSDSDNGGLWYNIFLLNKDGQTFKETNYYRMLVVSEYELSFTTETGKVIVLDLAKYQDRFVYAVFSDDENPQPIKIKTKTSIEEDCYVTTIRF